MTELRQKGTFDQLLQETFAPWVKQVVRHFGRFESPVEEVAACDKAIKRLVKTQARVPDRQQWMALTLACCLSVLPPDPAMRQKMATTYESSYETATRLEDQFFGQANDPSLTPDMLTRYSQVALTEEYLEIMHHEALARCWRGAVGGGSTGVLAREHASALYRLCVLKRCRPQSRREAQEMVAAVWELVTDGEQVALAQQLPLATHDGVQQAVVRARPVWREFVLHHQ